MAADGDACNVGGCDGTYTNGFCSSDSSHYEEPTLTNGVYQIDNAGKLYWFADYVNSGITSANAKLTANITVNQNVLSSSGALNGVAGDYIAWPMIGTSGYSGTFNGNGKTVSGLVTEYDPGNTGNNVGMFYSVSAGGKVQNVTLKDSYIKSHVKTGGFAVENYGTISGCDFYGTVENTSSMAVGIVVENKAGGVVENCEMHGAIRSSNAQIGGIAYSNAGTITGCINYSTFAGYSTGGIVSVNSGMIEKCINNGNIGTTSQSGVGGIAFCQEGGTISNCINTGTVSGGGYCGGLVGNNQSGSTVKNSYSTGSVVGSSAGVLVGSNTGTVTNCYYLADAKSGEYGEFKNATAFASGEVTYLLNGSTSEGDLAWYQNLATDAYPTLTGTDIVAAKTQAGGSVVYANKCGDNVVWTFESGTKTLTITGTGEMWDYRHQISNGEYTSNLPWFVFRENIETAVIGEGVTSIGSDAFSGCGSLTEIEIPDSVTFIGNSAFYGCGSLTEIEIPDGVTSIENSTFCDCGSLTEIEIPDGVTSIAGAAFSRCSSLTKIEIPAGVAYIGENAFAGCSGLTEIEIPYGVTSIAGAAFSGCSSLTEIEIPDSVTYIGDYAFHGCSGLTEIEIPDSVTTLGHYTFKNCTGLTTIEIPSSVKYLYQNIFENCTGLVSARVLTSHRRFQNMFKGCSNLTSVEWLNGWPQYSHFDGCTSLTTVTFGCNYEGNDLTSVFDGAQYPETINYKHYPTSCSADDAADTITEACTSCDADALGVATLQAPTSLTYDGTAKEASFEVEGEFSEGIPDISYLGDLTEGKPVKAGSYTATMSLGGESVSVDFTIEKADPIVGCTASSITYGDTLSESELTPSGSTAGSYAWEDGNVAPTAGPHTYKVLFTPEDATNYNSAELMVTVTVNKVQNAPNPPSALTVGYDVTSLTNDLLSSYTGWVWQNPGAAIPEGKTTFVAEYTADASNYENVTANVAVTRSDCAHASYDYSIEGTATIKRECTSCHAVESITLVVPTAANELVYDGQAKTVKYTPEEASFTPAPELTITGALVDGKVVNAGDYTATLTWGGVSVSAAFTVAKAEPDLGCTPANVTLTYGQTLGTVTLTATGTPGTYTWAEPTLMPTVADSGLTQYTVVFTPDDSVNYKGGTLMMTVTVNKATLANVPGDMTVGYDTETLSSALLSSFPNWNWETEGVDLAVGTESYNAIYNGVDKGNYTNETVVVAVTRTSCQEHSGGIATCKDKAECVHCDAPYGDTDPTNHVGGTELRDERAATCTTKEYTGDTYCLGCRAKLADGTETGEALGHSYGEPEVVDAQIGVPGVKTYTCTRQGCGHSYTEEIPALDPETTPNPENPTTTPNPTPELPELTPTVTPGATPTATPGAIVTPTITPDPTPDTPTTTPEVTPDTPTVVPTPTPDVTPDTPTTTPEVTPDIPTTTPEVTPDTPTSNPTNPPTSAPIPPSPSYPSVIPTSTPAPVWTPTPTPAPTEAPEATANPTPTAAPTATPTPEVTEAPKPTATPTPTPEPTVWKGYTVQVGAFSRMANAERCEDRLALYDYGTYLETRGVLVKVQTDVYETKAEADAVAKKLRKAGFVTYVVKTDRTPAEELDFDLDAIVREVILGRWGNGSKRKELLEAAGYVYRLIQDKVNELLMN